MSTEPAHVSPAEAGHPDSPGKAGGGDLQTRDLLIQAALKLFARYGFDGVSLRQISAEAQQLNQSVVHYYFHNKKGLIAAVLEYVAAQLQPIQAEVDEQLRAISRQHPPSVREIVVTALMPIVAWNLSSAVGRRSIRFISRLTWQAEQDDFDLLVARCLPYYESLIDHLQAALPHARRDAIAAKLLMTMVTVVHGLASTRVAIGSRALSASGVSAMEAMQWLEQFTDYLTGGLSSGPPA